MKGEKESMYSELMNKDKGRERKARIGSIDCLETATTSSSIDSQDNDRRMGAEETHARIGTYRDLDLRTDYERKSARQKRSFVLDTHPKQWVPRGTLTSAPRT